MTYLINKGVDAPLEFRGLKAQYITYLAVGLTALLAAFTLLYLSGAGAYLCVSVTLAAGTLLFRVVYSLNKRYGPYGLMRRLARRRLPTAVILRSRKPFLKKTPA